MENLDDKIRKGIKKGKKEFGWSLYDFEELEMLVARNGFDFKNGEYMGVKHFIEKHG